MTGGPALRRGCSATWAPVSALRSVCANGSGSPAKPPFSAGASKPQTAANFLCPRRALTLAAVDIVGRGAHPRAVHAERSPGTPGELRATGRPDTVNGESSILLARGSTPYPAAAARPQVSRVQALPHSACSSSLRNCPPSGAPTPGTRSPPLAISHPSQTMWCQVPAPADRVLDVRVVVRLRWPTFPRYGQILPEGTGGSQRSLPSATHPPRADPSLSALGADVLTRGRDVMRHQRRAAGVTASATVTDEPPQPGKKAARAVSRQRTGDDFRGCGTHAIPPRQ